VGLLLDFIRFAESSMLGESLSEALFLDSDGKVESLSFGTTWVWEEDKID